MFSTEDKIEDFKEFVSLLYTHRILVGCESATLKMFNNGRGTLTLELVGDAKVLEELSDIVLHRNENV